MPIHRQSAIGGVTGGNISEHLYVMLRRNLYLAAPSFAPLKITSHHFTASRLKTPVLVRYPAVEALESILCETLTMASNCFGLCSALAASVTDVSGLHYPMIASHYDIKTINPLPLCHYLSILLNFHFVVRRPFSALCRSLL
jgi:hypothetical protein